MPNSPFMLEHWLNKGYTEEDAKYQIAIRRPTTLEYWIHKGYTEEEAKQIRHRQNASGRSLEILVEKYGKQKGTELYEQRRAQAKRDSPRSIEYWISRGFSGDESKEKVKEYQTTFSKDVCIKKYGVEEGIKVYNERQLKWQKTLNSKSPQELHVINKKKNPYAKFNTTDRLDIAIQRSSKNKKLFEKCGQTLATQHEFINDMHKHFSLKEFQMLFSNKSIKMYYGITDENTSSVKREILKSFGVQNIKSRRYGYQILYDGIYYDSASDYNIAKWLTDHKIIFSYNKKYLETSKRGGFRYDFKLEDDSLYIENVGLLGASRHDKNEILKKYESNLQKKKKFILENNINVLFATEMEIINYLKNKYDK
jgi:hypothetical protein